MHAESNISNREAGVVDILIMNTGKLFQKGTGVSWYHHTDCIRHTPK